MEIRFLFQGSESGFHWSELLPYIPHLLWVALFFVTIILVGPGNIRNAISRASKIGFAGVELEFSDEINEAAEARNISLPIGLRDQLARRMKNLEPMLKKTRILWIDDAPSNNQVEISILRRLGVFIDLASTDSEARQKLTGAVYDIVLSDNGRAGEHEAGIAFLPEILASISRPLVVFYVGRERDTPKYAFGLTSRPDELFNLFLDAVERRKG